MKFEFMDSLTNLSEACIVKYATDAKGKPVTHDGKVIGYISNVEGPDENGLLKMTFESNKLNSKGDKLS
jgi:hypothetical protein